jgi:uncharacterized protein YwqG
MSFLSKWFKRKGPAPAAPATLQPLSFEDAIAKAGLLQFREKLEPLVRNSIFVTTMPSVEEPREIGSSHMGGLPDLPNGVSWPEVNGKRLAFLAQFNLSDLYPFDEGHLLPSSGLLLFFYDAEQSVWGFDPKDRDYWRVIFHPGSPPDMTRASLQEAASPIYFRECGVRFSSQPTLPDEPPDESLRDDERYSNLLNYLGAYSTHHQFLGHESPIQDDVRLECQLASSGIWCGDPSGYKSPQAKRLRPGAADWLLLFQMDSDDNPHMQWGDWGRLYFCIRRQDLQYRRFDRVWMVLQCT